MISFSDVNGDVGVWIGGRGGWIINLSNDNSISLGGGGFGLVTEHKVPDPAFDEVVDPDTEFYALNGYGGFIMEYTNRSYQLVHPTISALIGGGGLMVRDQDFDEIDSTPDQYFVFEPGANLEVNITDFFRLAVGVSYRLTSGISSAGYDNSDFSGINGMLTFKFGKFL